MKNNLAVIILAAGKGERMKSSLAKVLHPLCARPMLEYVFDLVKSVKPKQTVCVLGYKHQEVAKHIPKGIKIALQKKISGTADAVKVALKQLGGFKGSVLILYGDIPLLKKKTITDLLDRHQKSKAHATILTAHLDKPKGYGRIIRDAYDTICGIVEEKDADDVDKEIKETNTGIIVFEKARLVKVLGLIKPNNRKKEYYLTDSIRLFYEKGFLVEGLKITDPNEAMGINSRVELAKANAIMQGRINEALMLQGISIVDPRTAFIAYGTKIGQDTVIYPFTVIEKDVTIGNNCSVGPFVHLREGTRLKSNVLAGNFLEIVRSTIDSGTFIKHFSYLGDSRIGKAVNIGAGTVIANFDGIKKNLTEVKDNAFIGCDTVLVAPVRVGRYAITGAGSVVTKNKNVADGAIVAGVPAKILKKSRLA